MNEKDFLLHIINNDGVCNGRYNDIIVSCDKCPIEDSNCSPETALTKAKAMIERINYLTIPEELFPAIL